MIVTWSRVGCCCAERLCYSHPLLGLTAEADVEFKHSEQNPAFAAQPAVSSAGAGSRKIIVTAEKRAPACRRRR